MRIWIPSKPSSQAAFHQTCCVILTFLLMGTAIAAEAQERREFTRRLEAVLADSPCPVTIALEHLATAERHHVGGDRAMPSEGILPLGLMAAVQQEITNGRLPPKLLVTLADQHVNRPVDSPLRYLSPGSRIFLGDAVRLMIQCSDPSGTQLVLDAVDHGHMNQLMKSNGLDRTRFGKDSAQDMNQTTAIDIVRLLRGIEQKKLVSEEAAIRMKQLLSNQDHPGHLLRDLPPSASFAGCQSPTGDQHAEAGILDTPTGPVALCILSGRLSPNSPFDEQWFEDCCARIGRMVWNRFLGSRPAPRASEPLKRGSSGEHVEALQRTLRARFGPAGRLAVDGDFGPATESALRRFQAQHGLAVTGTTDHATWDELGDLLTAAEPVSEPETINARTLKRQPADGFDGPPFTTCRAWILAEAEGQGRLAGQSEDLELDIASTTKIMTAYMILDDAQRNPEILAENVTFSPRADQTGGSTSGLRAGDQLPVAELLFGLLLPSGNDAAVALAEHFGHRMSPPIPRDSATLPDPLQQFTIAMNITAKELGMRRTHFANPHGLTAKNHGSTVHDLLILTRKAWQLPRFRTYVGTRQRGCKVRDADGQSRNIVWENTNRLLEIEGYLGVKTGTTSAAGACLVSVSEFRGHERILILLGSSSSSARYTDSRNLFRWAWQRFPVP